MTKEELEEIKRRLRETEKNAAALGLQSPTTEDMQKLINELELLMEQRRLLLNVAEAAMTLWASGAGLLRTTLQDLRSKWPGWDQELKGGQ